MCKYTVNKLLRLFIYSGCVFQLTACTTNMSLTEDQADKNLENATRLTDQATGKAQNNLIRFDNNIFVASKAFKVEKTAAPLPSVFNEKFVFNSSQPLTLTQLANMISLQSSIAIHIDQDAKQYLSGDSQQKSAKSSSTNSPPVQIQKNKETNANKTEQKMQLHYVGTLRSLLEQVSMYFNLSWKYNRSEDRVEFFRYQTKTFRVSLVRGKTSSKNVIKNGDANSLSPQVSTLSMESGTTDQWADIESSINKLLSGVGSISVQPTSGYITVTTTPNTMKKVSSFIHEVNQVASKSVAVQVDIYDVEKSNSSNYGLDWNAVFKSGDNSLSVNTSAIPDALSDPFSSGAQTAVISADISGSTLILNALQSIGKITSHTSQMVYTVNGQPTALNMSNAMAYVKERDVNVQSGTGDDYIESSVTPGTIDTGFNLKLTPFIDPDNKVLLNMSVIMADLKSMRRVDTGTEDAEGYVELPSVTSKAFAYSAKLGSGQALIMAAFNDDSANASENSLLGEGLWALGGNKATAKSRLMTVVVVTPYIISGGNNSE
ncbi:MULTISPECIES: hypothetical protein [Cysteiniphilum]|uniref:hypothetical protein n=1 Tax=Cysteiniphilum TaxID=2056696 RepID=UPI0017852464|nr:MULTISPECIES: hypothetical protein [Cysteiniphilum]